MKTISKAISD